MDGFFFLAAAGAFALGWRARGAGLAELSRRQAEALRGRDDSLAACTAELERLRAIVESMADGVLLLDERGMVLSANPALRRFFGVERPVEGLYPAELVRAPRLLEALEAVRSSAEPKHVLFETFSPPAFFEVTALPVRRAGFGGMLALFRDVTRLERTERLRKDFVANASHELRTPVSSISACAESLLDAREMPAAQQRRFLEMIRRNAGRLTRLSQDLLELARLEAEHSTFQPQATSIAQTLELVLADLAEPLRERGASVLLELPPDLPKAWIDPEALERVLANLLDNAIRHGSANAPITVRCAPVGEGRLRLSVENSGEGIAAQHLSRIFERFYRVDRARGGRAGGTGLGLSIVRHAVEAHGGRVWAESEPDSKTTFFVELRQA